MLPDEHDLLFSGDATEDYGIVSPVTLGQHLACFAGGMFGLGGKLFGNASHVSIGDRLARGCAWAYTQFATGIMPEQFQMVPCARLDGTCPFNQKKWELQLLQGDPTLPTGFLNLLDPRYLLRPEAIESVFLLYRITGNPELQDLAWDMFQAVVNATETGVAHSAIANVTQQGVPDKTDQMDVSQACSPSLLPPPSRALLTAVFRAFGCPRL
jgi:mannosyl-oligosaccharide alpha-1,2-mannosidase